MTANRATILPSLPTTVGKEWDKSTQQAVKNLSEALDIRLGRRGDPLDRAVTVRDLVDAGIVKRLVNGVPQSSVLLNNSEFVYPTSNITIEQPEKPTGVSVSATFNNAFIIWNLPSYGGHAHAEIWRGTTNVLGDAVFRGTNAGSTYQDEITSGTTYYYFVRFVNENDPPEFGPWSDVDGHTVDTPLAPSEVADILAGQLDESHLVGVLSGRIDLIDTNGGISGRGLIEDAKQLIRVKAAVYIEDFSHNNTAQAVADWSQYTGNVVGTIESGTNPGGNYYWEIGGNASAENALRGLKQEFAVPVIQDTMFRVSGWFYEALGGVRADIGVVGFKGDVRSGTATIVDTTGGTTFTLSHMAVGGLGSSLASTTWTYIEAYFKSTGGAYAKNTGSVDNPNILHPDVEYATPVFFINNLVAGTARVSGLKIEAVDTAADWDLVQGTNKAADNADVTATAAAFTALDSQVTTNGTDILANASAITTLQSTVTNPTTGVVANASAISGLSTTIAAHDTAIVLNITDISTLEGYIGDYSASVTTLSEVVGTSDGSGTNLRAAHTVLTDVNGKIAGFGLYNDATEGSEFVIRADRFAIQSPTAADTSDHFPFVVGPVGDPAVQAISIDATAYIKNASIVTANIADLAVDTAQIGELAVTTAKIDNLSITTGKIIDLQVDTAKIALLAVEEGQIANAAVKTLKIGDNQVTVPAIQTNTAVVTGTGGATANVCQVQITTEVASRILVFWTLEHSYSDTTKGYKLRVERNASNRMTYRETSWMVASQDYVAGAGSYMQASAGTSTFYMYWAGETGVDLGRRSLTVIAAQK